MAHGGSEEWNAHVAEAIEPLKARFPVELALGMADAGSMEAAVRRLESQGVQHVGLVRVFVSGESWYERTLEILGIREGAPPRAEQQHSHGAMADMPMPMGFWKVDTELVFHVGSEGLADAVEMDDVVTARIRALSSDPDNEVVAVIAHGPGDDDENRRWIEKITERTRSAHEQLGMREIRVFTLREDWPERRIAAELEIRNYIAQANSQGLTPIVVPFRVQGFGPYERVLGELDYRADKLGLLPHPNVGVWIAKQASLMEADALEHHFTLASNLQ
ncbi:MAG: hypothetical protein OXP09_02470 [Gammaproteobacteria bacterium]|nr:hypothetical protein [Gammaproteobacteria bacterium]MDE0364418.1 hypothetical protein [Gammaproteobacteria bacterium]